MGQAAEDMITGVCCAHCGEFLECDTCEAMEIPRYCSRKCASNGGSDYDSVCEHTRNHNKYY